MLLLVTIGLVLVGAVSLVIGFASNDLMWIYLSIACSIVAAGVLVLFSRMSRQVPAPSAAGPTPLPDVDEPTLATAAVGDGTDGPATEAVAVPEAAAYGADVFPIEGYDKLRVNEIVPRLSDLDRAELEAVREREAAGKNRATVISRIDDLISQQGADAAADAAAAGVAGFGAELAAAEVGAATGAGSSGGDELDNIDDLIEDYDNLSVDQILPLLSELNEDELEDVAAYEEDHQNRDAVLDRIDAILEGEEIPPTPVKTSARKSTAKKSTPKKAASKVTASAKKTTSKASAPKKSASKVTAPKKAPVKSVSPAKKAANKAAAATKAAKAAAPAKKAAKKAAKRA